VNCYSQPDVVALNLSLNDRGTVWIKDVEVVALPLPGPEPAARAVLHTFDERAEHFELALYAEP
jgi:hypothetical protein